MGQEACGGEREFNSFFPSKGPSSLAGYSKCLFSLTAPWVGWGGVEKNGIGPIMSEKQEEKQAVCQNIVI